MAGDTLIRTIAPDGTATPEAAGQLLSRVLLRVGDDYLTIPDALADRPTGDVVARAIARAITDAITSLDPSALDGVAASGANGDITSLSGLTTAISVTQGGTGATTPAGARAALGLADALTGVRRSQLLRAVSQALPGGLAAFLAADPPLVSANPDDPSNLAYHHEPFALPGGVLAGLLTTYCRTTLGMSANSAAAQVAALFALASTLTPGT